MKTLHLVLISLFSLLSLLAFSQSRLADSPRQSSECFIYKLSREDLRKVHLKGEGFQESMLREPVAQYRMGAERPELPRGNYVRVRSVENKLHYSEFVVDDLYAKIIPSDKFVVCLHDSLGNIITDAEVRKGSTRLKFDSETLVYSTAKAREEQIVEIEHRGVFHYLEVDLYKYRYRKPSVFDTAKRKMQSWWYRTKENVRYVFYPSERPDKDKYTGFVVFNKPRYKPGETVKLKAYLAERKGKRYDKPIRLRLSEGYYFSDVDTLLATLEPYRPGMYTYEFTLNEGLNLKLDKNYRISLVTEDEDTKEVGDRFRYEDYELKSIRFSLSSDRKEFSATDTVRLKMKANDENDMAVYDGRVEVLVMPAMSYGRMSAPPVLARDGKPQQETFFVPDTLWNTTVSMAGMSEKELVLPDSIFPGGVDLDFRVECTYLSADNEKQSKQLSLSRRGSPCLLDFSLNKGMLTIKQLYRNESQAVGATLLLTGENGERLSAESVQLPHTLAVPWYASEIEVKTPHAGDSFSFEKAEGQQLAYQFYRSNDSVRLKVVNPAEIPFRYTLRKMKKEIAHGYATRLDYAVKDTGEDGYAMELTYLFGGKGKIIQASLPFVMPNIRMDVTSPTTVYPGQTAEVQIAVTDKQGNPVKDVDVTAYSFTAKFGDYSMPYVPIRGKSRHASPLYRKPYGLEDDYYTDAHSGMDWHRWSDALALRRLEYYQFLYPEHYYEHKRLTADGSTQISPYLVIDGELQGVHMLWIDERLYYAKQAEQQEVYAFRLKPGRHNLRFRTYDREVRVNNCYVTEGLWHIFSFNAGKEHFRLPYSDPEKSSLALSSRLLKKKERGVLSEKEVTELCAQLITVENRFGRIILPGADRSVEIPGYLRAGDNWYYLNEKTRYSYNSILRAQVKEPVLAGPFPQRNLRSSLSDMASVYEGGRLLTDIELEGGNQYTVYNGYQKIRKWDKPVVGRRLSRFTPLSDFRQPALTEKDIKKQAENALTAEMSRSSGFADNGQLHRLLDNEAYRLYLIWGDVPPVKKPAPVLIFAEPQREEDRKHYQLYYGDTRQFRNLPVSDLVLHFIFSDSTSYSHPLKLEKGGVNYLYLDSIPYNPDKKIARTAHSLFRREMRTVYSKNPYAISGKKDSIVWSVVPDQGGFSDDRKERRVVSGTVMEGSEPLIGATVRIKGSNRSTVTDYDGKFEIGVGDGEVLEVSYIGLDREELKVSAGYDYRISMKTSATMLEEVAVTGYSMVPKREKGTDLYELMGGSVSQVLSGRLAGVAVGSNSERIWIRGASSVAETKPLILIDGLPYDGDLADIDPAMIGSMNVLKDASATAIYGARAADGVIVIETGAAGTRLVDPEGLELPFGEQANSMRRNFHDDAFWQPKLKTDEKGEARFEVTYPDDITSWDAYFIAFGGKNQSSTRKMKIRSFKALSAQLSMPRFVVRGDSLHAIGKIVNHLGDSLRLSRTIEWDDKKQVDDISLHRSHVDPIPLRVVAGDSLKLAYSLRMANGYFDGEERSIPVMEQGMQETHGHFRVINDTATYRFDVRPELGELTVHAEASAVETFLREIDRVIEYPYLCNEQMASKIKALLAKKTLLKLQGKEFTEDKKIKKLINDLSQNRNRDGCWGWWNKSASVMWISRHVLDALLDAEEAGYEVKWNKKSFADNLEQVLKSGLRALPAVVDRKMPFAKGELLDLLASLKRLDAPVDYPAYLAAIDSVLPSESVQDRLKVMWLMSSVGLRDAVSVDSLMLGSARTLLGSLYWSEKQPEGGTGRCFYRPQDANTGHTLLAYRTLKNIGGHEKELESIRNYFFEQRKDRSWNNIYESSRIVQTIMPDMVKDKEVYGNATMQVNGKQVTRFPYTEKLEPSEAIQIKKSGTMPLFVTTYQTVWNKAPEKEASRGLKISSRFLLNGDTVAVLQEGKPVVLEVSLNLDGEAEYLQVEVPIPAGCTYESKSQGYGRKETHREHFKEKTVIFCDKLAKGEHLFRIELLPRYTGQYTLNPAKAELMYFPTFYGNEEVKKVGVKGGE